MPVSINQMDLQLIQYLSTNRAGEVIGKIYSKYNKVVNILSDDNEQLIAIAIDEVIQSPYMMRTNDKLMFFQMVQSLKIGERVYAVNKHQLKIGSYVIDYGETDVWDGNLNDFSFEKKDSQERLLQCQSFLGRLDKKAGILPAMRYLEKESPQKPLKAHTIYERKFIELLDKLEDEYTPDVLREFIGLGIGLTPSGDDFLTGLWATWQCFCFDEFRMFKQEKKEWLNFIRNRTTKVSYHMMKSCLDGYVNDALFRLLTCPPEDVNQNLEKLVTIGSTSGTDMISGVKWALERIVQSNSLYKRRDEDGI